MKAITCPAILTGASTRADGSLSLRFSTPELSSEDKAVFFDALNKNMTMLLEPNSEAEPGRKEIKGETGTKTPSQRLRAIIFVQWKQNKPGMTFDEFYARKMAQICEEEKELLEKD